MKTEGINVRWIAAVLCFIVVAFYYLRKTLRIMWLVARLPSPRAYPIIGHLHLINNHKELFRLSHDAYREYGPLIGAWFAFAPSVFVFEPEHLQKILGSPKHIEKNYMYKLTHVFLGRGLITSDGHTWRNHRKWIQPSFSMKVLESHVSSFYKGGKELLSYIDCRVHVQRDSINVTKLVNDVVVNVLNETILGLQSHSNNSPYRKGHKGMLERLQQPWLLLDSVYKMTKQSEAESSQMSSLYDYTKQAILNRRKLSDAQKTKRCLVDDLLELQDGVTDFTLDECVNELVTFMLAGQDSVGAALSFSITLLAEHPEVQEKVLAELDDIFGTSDREPCYEDVQNMRYLEQCVKETLRLYPSVPVMGRQLGEDVQLGDIVLPEGCSILISPFATHRMPKYFPNPAVFDPSRFDPGKQMHPYAFIPFSGGPRNCIGYKFALIEMKVILSTILRQYSLSAVPGKKINVRYRVTLKASGGLWAKFTPRKLTKSEM